MGPNENELKAISAAPEWAVPALDQLEKQVPDLVRLMAKLSGDTGLTGASAESAEAVFSELRNQFAEIHDKVTALNEVIRHANIARRAAADGPLPSTHIDSNTRNAITAGSFAFGPLGVLAAQGGMQVYEEHLKGQREDAAREKLEDLRANLASRDLTLIKTKALLNVEYVPDNGTPPPPPVGGWGNRTPRYDAGPSSVDYGRVGRGGPSQGGPGIGGPDTGRPDTGGPGTGGPDTGGPGWHPTKPSVDGGLGGGYVPGSGGSGGGGLSGGFGSGGGLGGAVAGGAGAATLAVGARLGGSGMAGTGGGLGGFGAAGGGAGGVGGMGAAGGAAAKPGAGGLLGGAKGGVGAAGEAAGGSGSAGGRPGASMMGGGQGGAGGGEKEKRSGLGGPMAPKLEDDIERGPRSAGAMAGGRDTPDITPDL